MKKIVPVLLSYLTKTIRVVSPVSSCEGLALAVLTFLFLAGNSRAENQIIDDTFDMGVQPQWHFLDTSASGSPWNITTDNTSPLSGPVMTNPKASTQAVIQFDPMALRDGDHIRFVLDLHTQKVQTTGAFAFSVLNTPELPVGNYFGYTTDPLATAQGYTYTQNYNSATSSILAVTQDKGSQIESNNSGPMIGTSAGCYLTLTLTRSGATIQIQATVNGASAGTIVDPAPSTTTFNTLRIDGLGVAINIDNVSVDSSVPATVYHFTLPHAYVTSAGVYTSSNEMVRELWIKRSLPAGTYSEAWNETDGSGNAVAAGTYKLKVLYHNMNYLWDGVVGDTSSSFTGNNNTYQSYMPITYMAISTHGDIYGSDGYNEAENSIYAATTTNPNSPSLAVPADQSAPFTYVAADETNYYFTDEGGHYDVNNNTFVMARTIQPQVPATAPLVGNLSGGTGLITQFAVDGTNNGVDVKTSEDAQPQNPNPQDYTSCIDVANEVDSHPTNFSVNAFLSGTMTLTLSSAAPVAVGDGITGPGINSNTTITAINNLTITISQATIKNETAENLTLTSVPFTVAVFSAGATTLTLSSPAQIAVGEAVTGPGIPQDSTITAVNNQTQTVTISQPTLSDEGPMYRAKTSIPFSVSAFSSGATTLSVSSAEQLAVGDVITGAGISSNTTITAINGLTITISQPTLLTEGAENLTVTSVSLSMNSFPSEATTLTLSSPAQIAVGNAITGPGIVGGTTITAINGLTITISQATTLAEQVNVALTANLAQYFDAIFVAENVATGLAVERGSGNTITGQGNLLAVSHGGLGIVRIYNKAAGANPGKLMQTLTISSTGTSPNGVFVPDAAAPGQVAFAPNGDLWVLTGTTAVRYADSTGVGNDYLPTTTKITGLLKPLAIAVNPLNPDVVAIADGGYSQQVKFYTSGGTFLYSIGQYGGYRDSDQGPGSPDVTPTTFPAVTNPKFFFVLEDFGNYLDKTFLAFDPTGDLWVGDLGNCRALHFTGTSYGTCVGQIATIPAFYKVSAIAGSPNRVFTGHLEYNVNYNVTLTPGDPGNPNDTISKGNGCWQLVRNWFGGNYDYVDNGDINNIVTFGNGKTYGIAQTGSGNSIVYLPASVNGAPTASARLTDSTPYLPNIGCMDDNGNIRYVTKAAAGGDNYTETINQENLGSPDGNGDPTWQTATPVAQFQVAAADPNNFDFTLYDAAVQGGWGMGAPIPTTADNNYVTFQSAGTSYVNSNNHLTETTPNCHLGSVLPNGASGAENFLWENSPGFLTDVPDGLGSYQDSVSYGGEAFGNHCGIAALAKGSQIVAGYDGQYGYYSNQWLNYNEDGMFIGQFGVTEGDYRAKPARLDTTTLGRMAVPGLAGNIGQAAMVTYNGTNYIYCSDEAYHAGIHRWRMDGTVNETVGNFTVTNPPSSLSVTLPTAATWPSTNYISNPGFEGEAATYSLAFGLGYTPNPVGWQVDNGPDGSGAGAFYTEWTEAGGYSATSTFARSLPYHATISKSTAYTVQPFQVITGLTSGHTYTFSAYVRMAGSPTAYIYCNPNPYTPFSPSMGQQITGVGSSWTQVTFSVTAPSSGEVEVGFHVQGSGYGTKTNPIPSSEYMDIDDVSFN